MIINICCTVIDNYGDAAVAWRLIKDLTCRCSKDWSFQLLIDDVTALNQLNPIITVEQAVQVLDVHGHRVKIINFTLNPAIENIEPGDVLIEAFGVRTPAVYFNLFCKNLSAYLRAKLIIHLEYLSPEDWSQDYHLLPSPLGIQGVEKFFFVPGFHKKCGGIIVDPDFIMEKINARKNPSSVRGWLSTLINQTVDDHDYIITVFSYQHNYTNFWQDWALWSAQNGRKVKVLVFKGLAYEGAKNSWVKWQSKNNNKLIDFISLPFLSQEEYDKVLLLADFNIVRGEESFVRAILSGRPFLWHAYLQDDAYQMAKVEGFLQLVQQFFQPFQRALYEDYATQLRQFNQRTQNDSLQKSDEKYIIFGSCLKELNVIFEEMAVYMEKNLDLGTNLLDFILRFRLY